MSLKRFGTNELVLNTMRAHPKSEFLIFSGNVLYNNRPPISGAFTGSVLSMSGTANSSLTGSGYISLYEYNIDKSSGQPGDEAGAVVNPFSYPFITKDSAGASFRTVSDTAYATEFAYGDTLVGKYPLSASITREFMNPAGKLIAYADSSGFPVVDQTIPIAGSCTGEGVLPYLCDIDGEPKYRHYWALKNRLNFYGVRSPAYRVTGAVNGTTFDWIKDEQTINMISVPSIFYGTRIYPGSVSLRWYFTGSLIGELRDLKQNGELIQLTSSYAQTETNPNLDDMSGSVAGVVLYEEGIILLTGSWALNGETIPMIKDVPGAVSPSWIYFGAGANDGINATSTGTGAPGTGGRFNSASFGLSFKGQTDTQVVTMFANARRGQANYSNNPTFLQYGQEQIAHTSSQVYEENSRRLIKNTVSSSYAHQSASFERQVYISRVALYDSSKNLIGVATLANPVLKKEDEDLTFKLRLDI